MRFNIKFQNLSSLLLVSNGIKTTNFIENWKLITLLSHPQIAYELIEAGGAEDILQNKNYI